MANPRALWRFEPRMGYALESPRHPGDEIVSIVSATPGWRVRYATTGPGKPEYWYEPVACWAVINRFGRTVVVGLLAMGDEAELATVSQACGPAFDGYYFVPDDDG